jgi:hypothetical protein
MYTKDLSEKELELTDKEKKRETYKFKPIDMGKTPMVPGYEEYVNKYFESLNEFLEGK